MKPYVDNKYNTKTMIILDYLKKDSYWINNDMIYNDIIYDMNTLFHFAVHEAVLINNFLGLIRFLYYIYSDPDIELNTFKDLLIEKIIETVNT
jgi:hypothetical protein